MTDAFPRAWLIGWLAALGLSVGCMTLLFVHHLVHGRWGAAIRPLLSAGTRALPLVALGFVPVALGTGDLYLWTDADFMSAEAVLRHKAWYLTDTGFAVRAAVCLVAWSALALAVTRRPRDVLRPRLAAGGFIALVLTVTVAAVDWVASLDPAFSSSAFGLLLLAGQVVAGLSAVILLAVVRFGGLEPDRSHDLGNLLFMAVMLWGYIAFAQFLLVWSADLPNQSAWYLRRADGAWQALLVALVALRLALPLVALLFRSVKRHPRRLAVVAGILLVTHLIELYWMVLPADNPSDLPGFSWLDAVVPAAFLTLWVVSFRRLGPPEVMRG